MGKNVIAYRYGGGARPDEDAADDLYILCPKISTHRLVTEELSTEGKVPANFELTTEPFVDVRGHSFDVSSYADSKCCSELRRSFYFIGVQTANAPFVDHFVLPLPFRTNHA